MTHFWNPPPFNTPVEKVEDKEDPCLFQFYQPNEVLGLVCTCPKCSMK